MSLGGGGGGLDWHLAVNSVLAPLGIWKQQKTCFFIFTALRSQGFQTMSFWNKKSIDWWFKIYKSNKTICFVFFQSECLILWPVYAVLLSWNSYVYLKNGIKVPMKWKIGVEFYVLV